MTQRFSRIPLACPFRNESSSLSIPMKTKKCFACEHLRFRLELLVCPLISVSSKRCSPPKVFRAFLTHFWRNFDGFLTHFGRSSFPNKTRPILTHFWRIFDAFLTHFWRILAIADAFSENTFWTIPIIGAPKQVPKQTGTKMAICC